MTARFNPAPGWPPAPTGWTPPPGWTRDAGWPPAPAGWPFWVDDVTGLPVPDPTRPARPWYARKAVAVPAAVMALLLVAGVAGAGESEPSDRVAPAVSASTDPGAEAVAAAEASAAADEREAAEREAAEREAAEREALEREAAEVAAREAAAREAERLAAERAAEEAAAAQAAAAAAEAAAAEQAAALAAATWVVTDIVDGDTIDVLQGDRTERVRVIGMDTPERGQCGFDDAANALAGLVLGERVVLVAGARDDRDRYDRILRYVDREYDGLDAGLALIESGHAIARYDSRDGYGRHDREDTYVAADAAAADQAVCAVAPPPPAPAPGPAPLVSVSYANCDAVRAAGADPIRVGDPGWDTKFDRDGDGVGCE